MGGYEEKKREKSDAERVSGGLWQADMKSLKGKSRMQKEWPGHRGERI